MYDRRKLLLRLDVTFEDHLAEYSAKIAYCNRALTYVEYFRTIILDNDGNLNNN